MRVGGCIGAIVGARRAAHCRKDAAARATGPVFCTGRGFVSPPGFVGSGRCGFNGAHLLGHPRAFAGDANKLRMTALTVPCDWRS